LGQRELQDQLKKKYSIDVPYYRVVRGKLKALDMIYGKWEDSYDWLPTYQAELLRSVPGSIVELETEDHNGDVCFVQGFKSRAKAFSGGAAKVMFSGL
jgi:hypothetical protein